MNPVFPLTALMATIGCLSVVAQQGTSQSVTSPPVTSQMLLDGLKDPTKWLMFGGDYTSRRNSPLTQLTPQNVNQLTPQWLFQTPAPAPGRGLESTPVVLVFDFDFESPSPKGFFTGGCGYSVQLDSTVAHTGNQSLRMQYGRKEDASIQGN